MADLREIRLVNLGEVADCADAEAPVVTPIRPASGTQCQRGPVQPWVIGPPDLRQRSRFPRVAAPAHRVVAQLVFGHSEHLSRRWRRR